MIRPTCQDSQRLVRTMLLSGTMLAAAPAFAQQADPQSTAAPAPATQVAPQPTATVPEPTAGRTGVEEIIVTAQKREQNLQSVPISITALSADAIVSNRIQDVRDLSAIAPNLTVRLATGGSQQPNYTLRGILTGGSAAGTDKGVSLYIDGVYIQNVQGSVFEFADVERIEVLKGPQGTLFGRNATGGAISIITKDPTGVFKVKEDATYGNYNTIRSRTRVDLPKFGPISASFSYLHSEHNGDVRNLGAGTVWDYGPASGGKMGKYTSPKRLGGDNVEAFTGALKFDLDPDLDLVYKYDYSENHYTPNAQGVGYLPTGFLTALTTTSPNPQTPVTTKRPKAVNNAYHIPSFTRTQGHNLTARYHLTDQITFKNIFAYRRSNILTAFQLDGLGGLVNSLPVAPGVAIAPSSFPGGNPGPGATIPNTGGLNTNSFRYLGTPFEFLANNGDQHEQQLSDEFQVNINTDWFNVTAGYLHFHDHVRTAGIPNQYNTSILTAIVGQGTSAVGTPFVIPANPGYQQTRVTVNSDAFFVQPEFHLTDQLDIVGGLRITKDRKNGTEFVPNPTVAIASGIPVASPIRYRNSRISVLAGVNYKVTDNILTYGKYATGYISGGQLATIAFAPETAKSFEAGIKAELFDRRLRSNLAAFHVKYRNIQYTTSGQLTGIPSAFFYAQAVVPSGDATAKGFEWENTLVPVDGLTLTANVGYTDFKFKDGTIFPGFVFQSGIPGYRAFQRPKWTGNLAAQYETPEFFHGGHLVARADGNFRSKILQTSDLSPGSGPTAPEDPVLTKAATTPFQWIVNGRLGLVDIEVGPVKAYVAAWGRNLFDNKHIVQFSGLGPVASVIYERARTYGVDVGFEF